MNWLDYDTGNCSVRRTLEVVGEKWTLLILRECFNGVGRFDQIRDHVGVSDPVLATRLRTLVDAGVLEAVPYREPGRRRRHEYRLTDQGRDLYPVVMALREWGDRHRVDAAGPPILVRHRDCGAPVTVSVRCTDGHELTSPREARVEPGPGARLAADSAGTGGDQ